MEDLDLWCLSQSSSPRKCRFHLGFSLGALRRLPADHVPLLLDDSASIGWHRTGGPGQWACVNPNASRKMGIHASRACRRLACFREDSPQGGEVQGLALMTQLVGPLPSKVKALSLNICAYRVKQLFEQVKTT